jgi:hypothetical protein
MNRLSYKAYVALFTLLGAVSMVCGGDRVATAQYYPTLKEQDEWSRLDSSGRDAMRAWTDWQKKLGSIRIERRADADPIAHLGPAFAKLKPTEQAELIAYCYNQEFHRFNKRYQRPLQLMGQRNGEQVLWGVYRPKRGLAWNEASPFRPGFERELSKRYPGEAPSPPQKPTANTSR